MAHSLTLKPRSAGLFECHDRSQTGLTSRVQLHRTSEWPVVDAMRVAECGRLDDAYCSQGAVVARSVVEGKSEPDCR